jgi:hypothetical protein
MHINPEVLVWARELSGMQLEAVYTSFRQKNYDAWEKGEDCPTYSELKKIGRLFNRPIAMFFFSEKPDLPDVRASFGTLQNSLHVFERELVSLVEWGKAMQLNLYGLHEGAAFSQKPAARQARGLPSADEAVSALRSMLRFGMEEQRKAGSAEEAFELLRGAFFEAGIHVFKKGFKSGNVAAFSLHDDAFPVICIDNALAFSRQIYALFHEMHHLVWRISGVDFLDDSVLGDLDSNHIEKGCNDFAATFLAQCADSFGLADRGWTGDGAVGSQKPRSRRGKACSTGDWCSAQVSDKGRHYVDLAYSSYFSGKITLLQLADCMDLTIPSLKELYNKTCRGDAQGRPLKSAPVEDDDWK